MVVFADASFENNADSSTQLGYMILQMERSDRANCLFFTSYIYKRIVRSVLGETYSFADGLDAEFGVLNDIQKMIGNPISLIILTDSESLLNIIVESTVATKKLLMTDIRAARGAYITGAISDVGWIRTHKSIADGLNNVAKSLALEEFCGQGNSFPQHRTVVRAQCRCGGRTQRSAI